MHAIVPAGGRPNPDEPLYPFLEGQPKSMLDVAGKPMVQWVLDALNGSSNVDEILIMGLDPGTPLESQKKLHFIPDQGGLIDNMKAGLDGVAELPNVSTHCAVVSADIPTITTEIVDWRIESALERPADLDYAVIKRSVMEARFPEARRTYIRMRDGQVCGADMNIARIDIVTNEELWTKLINSRKNPAKQAMLLGIGALIRFASGQASIEYAEGLAKNRLGVDGRLRFSPYAEIGMDIDKPAQLDMLAGDLTA